ncbi:hypothetical protein SY86_00705 [Erwinia tracheiphila]|uniref:Uncharacterized protein n=1 Tax=Erwinia tracheiphila TaxID=65700 RepID=A0A0M2KL89_9GAMM|nr:hypothetical protein SY86_00705 [Erwinia tracheiphila]
MLSGTRFSHCNFNLLNKKTKKPAIGAGFKILSDNLNSGNVSSRWAFGTVGDFELYTLTFSQSFETVALDGREVYEHVFATIFRSNETESFGLIKPLNATFDLRHLYYLYMKNGH